MEKNNLQDCGGCTDDRSEGTHAMHTKQHPCPEGGDPNCGYCFPEKNNAEIERIVREWKSQAMSGQLDSTEADETYWRNALTTFKAHIEAALLEEIEKQLPLEFPKKTPAFQMGWDGALAHIREFITTRKEQIG